MHTKSKKKIRFKIIQEIRINKAKKQERKRASQKGKERKKRRRIEEIRTSSIRTPRRFKRSNSLSNKVNAFDYKELKKKKENQINNNLPINLKYLLHSKESPFHLKNVRGERFNSYGVVDIPESFSIIDNPKETFIALKKIISALFCENNSSLILNYEKCNDVELGTQVLLDIILREFCIFTKKVQISSRDKKNLFPAALGGKNINNEDIQKLLFSVGSPANLNVQEKDFKDIIKYKLCIHDNIKEKNFEKRIAQKEIDTTQLVDYVIECLKRMNKELTSEKLDDLCTVIGEILINAEEHSSTQHRFSIGYFKEEKQESKHLGIFRLVILNFGQTIYQKFKSKDCPNKKIVQRMEDLSYSYTKRKLFSFGKFEEECLWTLYALQEGVTSVSTEMYKRGNGSIRFIDSFFNIKESQDVDNISRMSILSGRTRIIFNGEYNIMTKENQSGDIFKVMTFNKSGNIEEKPDNKYVYSSDYYFPGTMITARILLNDDDIKQIKE